MGNLAALDQVANEDIQASYKGDMPLGGADAPP
jgi:hypothetical protein